MDLARKSASQSACLPSCLPACLLARQAACMFCIFVIVVGWLVGWMDGCMYVHLTLNCLFICIRMYFKRTVLKRKLVDRPTASTCLLFMVCKITLPSSVICKHPQIENWLMSPVKKYNLLLVIIFGTVYAHLARLGQQHHPPSCVCHT